MLLVNMYLYYIHIKPLIFNGFPIYKPIYMAWLIMHNFKALVVQIEQTLQIQLPLMCAYCNVAYCTQCVFFRCPFWTLMRIKYEIVIPGENKKGV